MLGDGGKCYECADNHFLVNDDQNCCEIGEKYDSGCVSGIDNCIAYDADDCTEC